MLHWHDAQCVTSAPDRGNRRVRISECVAQLGSYHGGSEEQLGLG
jgi:hypothetical protein